MTPINEKSKDQSTYLKKSAKNSNNTSQINSRSPYFIEKNITQQQKLKHYKSLDQNNQFFNDRDDNNQSKSQLSFLLRGKSSIFIEKSTTSQEKIFLNEQESAFQNVQQFSIENSQEQNTFSTNYIQTTVNTFPACNNNYMGQSILNNTLNNILTSINSTSNSFSYKNHCAYPQQIKKLQQDQIAKTNAQTIQPQTVLNKCVEMRSVLYEKVMPSINPFSLFAFPNKKKEERVIQLEESQCIFTTKKNSFCENEYNFSFSNNIKQQKDQQQAINFLEKNLEKIDKNLIISSIDVSFWSLDSFQIGKCIGRGRFGNVYMARHKQTNMLVAIKQINKKSLQESCMEKQLEQEIKIQMFASHPNILRMYGFFHDETKIYLILELASHFDIYKELKKEPQKRFTEEKTANYIRQISEGLIYLHSHGIIHRDIKPENILNIHGVLKISDFGWSVYTPEEKRMTFCGTLDYVSPEIVQGADYDQKVDIWSIGVLCYELLVGKPPFENKGLDETLNFPLFVSESAREFIKLLLVKEPGKRTSIEKALNHPWIINNTKNCLDDWDVKISEECLYLLR